MWKRKKKKHIHLKWEPKQVTDRVVRYILKVGNRAKVHPNLQPGPIQAWCCGYFIQLYMMTFWFLFFKKAGIWHIFSVRANKKYIAGSDAFWSSYTPDFLFKSVE